MSEMETWKALIETARQLGVLEGELRTRQVVIDAVTKISANPEIELMTAKEGMREVLVILRADMDANAPKNVG